MITRNESSQTTINKRFSQLPTHKHQLVFSYMFDDRDKVTGASDGSIIITWCRLNRFYRRRIASRVTAPEIIINPDTLRQYRQRDQRYCILKWHEYKITVAWILLLSRRRVLSGASFSKDFLRFKTPNIIYWITLFRIEIFLCVKNLSAVF